MGGVNKYKFMDRSKIPPLVKEKNLKFCVISIRIFV